MGASTAAAAASGMPGGSACSTSWGSRWSPAHKIDREDNAKQVVEWVGEVGTGVPAAPLEGPVGQLQGQKHATTTRQVGGKRGVKLHNIGPPLCRPKGCTRFRPSTHPARR